MEVVSGYAQEAAVFADGTPTRIPIRSAKIGAKTGIPTLLRNDRGLLTNKHA